MQKYRKPYPPYYLRSSLVFRFLEICYEIYVRFIEICLMVLNEIEKIK